MIHMIAKKKKKQAALSAFFSQQCFVFKRLVQITNPIPGDLPEEQEVLVQIQSVLDFGWR